MKKIKGFNDCLSAEEQAALLLVTNPKVSIYHNNDTGIWQWSVSIVSNDPYDAFWLDSFKTKKGALAFIKRHKLIQVE